MPGKKPGSGGKKDALGTNLGQVTRRIPVYEPRTDDKKDIRTRTWDR
jgi:hypothetical protein